jgi:hypothetical protein
MESFAKKSSRMYEETNLIQEDLSLSNAFQADLSVVMCPLPTPKKTDIDEGKLAKE